MTAPVDLSDIERQFIAYRLRYRAKTKLREYDKARAKVNLNPMLLRRMKEDISECERIADKVDLPPL